MIRLTSDAITCSSERQFALIFLEFARPLDSGERPLVIRLTSDATGFITHSGGPELGSVGPL